MECFQIVPKVIRPVTGNRRPIHCRLSVSHFAADSVHKNRAGSLPFLTAAFHYAHSSCVCLVDPAAPYQSESAILCVALLMPLFSPLVLCVDAVSSGCKQMLKCT